MFSKNIFLLSLSIGLFFILTDVENLKAEESQFKEGMTLKTSQPVILRELPPNQKYFLFVDAPGEKIGKIQKGKQVEVEGVKKVDRPLSKDIWIKVKTIDESNTKTGWVYYGKEKEAINFNPE